MINCGRLLILFFLFSSLQSQAQWSILDNDPRYNDVDYYLYQRFTKKEWNDSNFANPQDVKWFVEARYGMFIHFGLNSYVNKDMSWPIVYNRKMPDNGHGAYPDSAWQIEWPSKFKLDKFNAKEWVSIAREAGMKYMIIVVKHHDGFHMWNTDFSDFKITNTPFGRDYLRELVDACHEANFPVGLYYSQRDWYHPDYEPIDINTAKFIPNPPYYEALPGNKVKAGAKHQKYIEYQFKAIRELLTKYGKIDIFWFDASYWGGMFTADMWESERLTRMIRDLQPHILINNRASLAGDFDTPEQRIGMYQDRPWESAMTLNGSWGYDPEHKIKPIKKLIHEMLTAAGGNGNVLMSWGAKFNGEYDQGQKDTLLKIGAWLKQNGAYYYGTKGGPWMPTKEYATVHKGNQVYVYLFDQLKTNLNLPALKFSKLLNARYVTGGKKLNWKKTKQGYTFSRIQKKDDIVEIIALQFDKPIREIDKSKSISKFDSPSYGKLIREQRMHNSAFGDNNHLIDLQTVRNVTGIGIYGMIKGLKIEYSADGSNWQKLNVQQGGKQQELSLSTFMTGVQVPGKEVRYLRINGESISDTWIKIYSK